MKKSDLIFPVVSVFVLTIWISVTGQGGFKSPNSIIIARAFVVSATIDGLVVGETPEIGRAVSKGDLLIRIENDRTDKSKLTLLTSTVDYLEIEITNTNKISETISILLLKFRKQATAYAIWKMKDLSLAEKTSRDRLTAAKIKETLKRERLDRLEHLSTKKLVSVDELERLKSEADIALKNVDISNSENQRNELLLDVTSKVGAFQDNGDASYWERMVDTLEIKQLETLEKTNLLKSDLQRTLRQLQAEQKRISATDHEEHIAVSQGIINANYVASSARVVIGTPLLEFLDCTSPLVIVPLPENRINDFSAGMKTTIYPVDSDLAIPGKIMYISSGSLIGSDNTIAIQPELLIGGPKAIVSFEKSESEVGLHCVAARRAVVYIHFD